MNKTHFLKTIITFASCAFFFMSVNAQLSGTKLIDNGGSGDYQSFSEAVDSLKSQGVSGAVTFNVANGTYTEQIIIPAITGVNATNTITFQSQSGDSTQVNLNYDPVSADDNWVVRLDTTGYITFRKLRFSSNGADYARIMVFNGTNHITVENCEFQGKAAPSLTTDEAVIYSNDTPDDSTLVQNSRFINGSYGVRLEGKSPSVRSQGIRLMNNTFINQSEQAILLSNQDAPFVDNNYIYASNDYANGIKFYYCNINAQITNNRIELINGGYGIYLNNSDGQAIDNGLIANNFISVSGNVLGYGIYSSSSIYQSIFHNSINITNTYSGTATLRTSSCNSLDIRNNIFTNFGGGYIYEIGSASEITASDYNNYFGTGNFIADWGGTDIETLADLQSANSMDANSVSVNPVFTSSSDLHTTIYTLDNIGDNTVGIGTDIDNESRGGTPDIGADEFTGAGSPLNGTYTIGGTSPDFSNFSEAVDSLNKGGISGPVVFNVRDGNYTEQFEIYPVTGSSVTNTVTFQSESGDSSAVNLSFSATAEENYIIKISAADNLVFRKMTLTAGSSDYSRIFSINGSSRNDTIENCILNGSGSDGNQNSAIFAGDALINNIYIRNNSIYSGREGISLNAYEPHASGIEIITNTLYNQTEHGIYVEDCDATVIKGNLASTSVPSSYYGIQLEDCDDDNIITYNRIFSSNQYGGIKIDKCTGSFAQRTLIANNFVSIEGNSKTYGISTDESDYANVFYNSVNITNTNTGSCAFYNYSGSNIQVKNSIFANSGGGYAYYTNSGSAISASDHNDLFATGESFAYWEGEQINFNDFKAASGTDANSVAAHPGFISSTDLHVTSPFLDNTGTPLSEVSDDIDGEARDGANPDIGADEFTTASTPLSGTYTIGGTTPDYASFTNAVNDLNILGISGNVVFNVRPDTYNEQFEIFQVPGASATDSIIFQSATGDSSSTILTYNAGSSDDNYIVKMAGADYITFSKLTFSPSGSTYGRAFWLEGNVKHLHLLNCIFSATSSSNQPLISTTDNHRTDHLLIKNCTFSEGSSVIYLNGDVGDVSTGTQIIDNTFSSGSGDIIYLLYNEAAVIKNNTFITDASGAKGIYLLSCENGIQVTGNKIYSSTQGTGIEIDNCDAISVSPGLVANNFISLGGTSTAYGIDVSGTDYLNVYHNSVLIRSTNTSSGRGLNLYSGNYIDVKNNIFANTGGGYGYYKRTAASNVTSDNNNIYATGTNIARWDDIQYTNLSILQSATSMDNNSLSVNPMFYSNADLHILQPQLNEAATPMYDYVPYDIDGIVRDSANPDIGAQEFYCETPAFNVKTSLTCFGDSVILTDSTTNVAPGSVYQWDFDNDWSYDTTLTDSFAVLKHYFSTADTHKVNLVIDQIAGCLDAHSIDVVVHPLPQLTITTKGAYCDSADAWASVDVSGGIPPYTYHWSNGSTTDSVTGLDIGKYTIAVNDSNNCTATDEVRIESAVEVAVTEISPATCGNEDGIASASATGGVQPYSYIWSNDVTTQNDSSLSPGMHYVNVIDDNGCMAFGSINITSSGTGPSVSLNSFSNNDCYGNKTGYIDVDVSGGQAPYTYEWSNGKTTEDIDSLRAGLYELTVTDDNGCIAVENLTITAPEPLSISTTVTDASCSGSDGNAVLIVSGGTRPYSYNWPTGGISAIETGLAADVYAVTITDDNGCSKITPVIVNNAGGPEVSLVSSTGVTCTDTASGAVDISVSGGSPPYTYLWSPSGNTTQDVNNLTKGWHKVVVTDMAGCEGVLVGEIEDQIPPAPSICMVTVDTLLAMNRIVWEKTNGNNIASYNIYKEGDISGEYYIIGNVLYDDMSEFVDSNSNAQQRSWRYKIAAVDSCGIESKLSKMHKTMHLMTNTGLTGEINLIWDHYQGFNYSTYKILRRSESTGLESVTTISASSFSYSDFSPPADVQFYIVSAVKPDSCIPTSSYKASSGPYSQSLSNMEDNGIKGGNNIKKIDISALAHDLVIFPNPLNDKATILFKNPDHTAYTLTLTDISGKVVRKIPHIYSGRFILHKGNLDKGIYFIEMKGNKRYIGKLVIQ